MPAPGRVWLYTVPVAAFLILGIFWMARTEGRHEGSERPPYAVTGTSGANENDPEGLGRGDERPLNPGDQAIVIRDMGLLSAKDDYVGRRVEIPAIPVMSTPGPRTIWVGRLANRTLVLLDRRAHPADQLTPGEHVRVGGRLERRPDQNAIDRAGLHEKDREALEGVDVFIRASAIEPAGPALPTRQ
jgi:hypothetical protein